MFWYITTSTQRTEVFNRTVEQRSKFIPCCLICEAVWLPWKVKIAIWLFENFRNPKVKILDSFMRTYLSFNRLFKFTGLLTHCDIHIVFLFYGTLTMSYIWCYVDRYVLKLHLMLDFCQRHVKVNFTKYRPRALWVPIWTVSGNN